MARPPASPAARSPAARSGRPAWALLRGALAAIALSFPAAALTALVYRFPIPFGGYQGGAAAVPLSLGAVLFYGVLGGFVVVGGLGALAGLGARALYPARPAAARRLTWLLAGAVALGSALFLAGLDRLIGPW